MGQSQSPPTSLDGLCEVGVFCCIGGASLRCPVLSCPHEDGLVGRTTYMGYPRLIQYLFLHSITAKQLGSGIIYWIVSVLRQLWSDLGDFILFCWLGTSYLCLDLEGCNKRA